jgi:hypothetical protein
MLSDLFNILMIALMLTGALCWVSAILLGCYFWACKPKRMK